MDNSTKAALALLTATAFIGSGYVAYTLIRNKQEQRTIEAVVNGLKMQLDKEQVRSVQAILDAWKKYGDGDYNKLAYILATARHESRLKPVRECFAQTDERARLCVAGNHRPYAVVKNGHVYYGRGFVQLTWENNYRKMGQKLGIDLVNNPDKALLNKVAAEVLVKGMMDGDFTGKGLNSYINGSVVDFRNARRTVNGTDRADLIAGYANDMAPYLKPKSSNVG